MSTVDSEIQVAKLACDLLKETPLSQWEDDTAVGRWMKRNFPIVRNIVLSQTPWNFAIRRALLQRDVTRPEYNWQSRYAIPRDCLRILPIRYGGTMNGNIIDWEREGMWILTNQVGDLKVRMIFEQKDAGTWSALFVDALSTALAMRMSEWMTGKNKFTEMMSKLHEQAMTAAVFANGAEGIASHTTGTYYDDVRHGTDYINYSRNY